MFATWVSVLLSVMIVIAVIAFWVGIVKMFLIFEAFDKVIIKTLTDTKYIDENMKLAKSMTSYAELTKKINDSQMIEFKKQIQVLTSAVKELNIVNRRDR